MKYLFIFVLSLFVFLACNSEENTIKINENICVVLAHHDDETVISGTLAKLAKVVILQLYPGMTAPI